MRVEGDSSDAQTLRVTGRRIPTAQPMVLKEIMWLLPILHVFQPAPLGLAAVMRHGLELRRRTSNPYFQRDINTLVVGAPATHTLDSNFDRRLFGPEQK